MPFQGLTRFATDVFKGGRDKLMDAVGIDYPEQLFIKSMSGGAAGDGTIRELPPEVIKDVRTQFDRQTADRSFLEKELAMAKSLPKDQQAPWHDKFVSSTEQRLAEGDYLPKLSEQNGVFHKPVSNYGSSRDAHLGLGTVQVYRNPDGSVRITDIWDVDVPDNRLPDGRIMDLAEGGMKATRVFDAANKIGSYQAMPIDVQLTANEWRNAQRSRMDQIRRSKNMDQHSVTDEKRNTPKDINPYSNGEMMGPAGAPSPSQEEITKLLQNF